MRNTPSWTSSSKESDSDNSESNADVLHPSSGSGNSPALRPVECKWIDCGKSFKYLDDLAAHVTSFHANSGAGGLFFCGWEGCTRGNRGFNARYKMLVHVRTHTNEKPHHCFQCEKSFSRAENLKIHARSHTGERPYVCPVPGCAKAYSNSSDRFKHTRTHSVDKPYVCKLPGCGKRYTDPSSLRKHVKTYRHFSGKVHAEESPSNIPSQVLKPIDDEIDHEQIVPQAEAKLMQSLGKRACFDSASTHYYYYYYYNLEGDKEINYNVLTNWFDGEHARWYHNEKGSFRNGHYKQLQDQEMPLDLTVQK